MTSFYSKRKKKTLSIIPSVSQDSDQDIDFIIDDNLADHDLNASALFGFSDIEDNENDTRVSF